MLTKADDGGMDPRSGNSHAAHNQSLQNAAYRFGNFAAHVLAGGPDDRLVENFGAPRMAMDAPAADALCWWCERQLDWPCWRRPLAWFAAMAAG